MSEYWIEIHPEEPQHIIISDELVNILKNAKFPEKLDVQILCVDNTITIIFYKLGLEFDKKMILIGNKITGIEHTDISKIYKFTERIYVTFEQRDTYQQTNIDFDVFVIDLTIDKPTEKNEESLEDMFK